MEVYARRVPCGRLGWDENSITLLFKHSTFSWGQQYFCGIEEVQQHMRFCWKKAQVWQTHIARLPNLREGLVSLSYSWYAVAQVGWAKTKPHTHAMGGG